MKKIKRDKSLMNGKREREREIGKRGKIQRFIIKIFLCSRRIERIQNTKAAKRIHRDLEIKMIKK